MPNDQLEPSALVFHLVEHLYPAIFLWQHLSLHAMRFAIAECKVLVHLIAGSSICYELEVIFYVRLVMLELDHA